MALDRFKVKRRYINDNYRYIRTLIKKLDKTASKKSDIKGRPKNKMKEKTALRSFRSGAKHNKNETKKNLCELKHHVEKRRDKSGAKTKENEKVTRRSFRSGAKHNRNKTKHDCVPLVSVNSCRWPLKKGRRR